MPYGKPRRQLTQAPTRALEGQIRLPLIQNPEAAIRRSWFRTMMPPGSLRTIKTTGKGTCYGRLAPIQSLVVAQVGYVNDAASMGSGLKVSNARRLVNATSGGSAGAAMLPTPPTGGGA
jgi:hypothetical protein